MKVRNLLTASALVALAGTQLAHADVEVIFSRAVGSPTSSVPGAVDLAGAPMAATFSSMLEFWLSPDGTKWLLRGATDAGSDLANYLILGSGASEIMNLQEGRPFPGAVGNELLDFHSSTSNRPFNANNEWAFAIRARGGLTANAQKIVKFTAANVGSLAAQQGDLYTGLSDTGTPGDEIMGNSAGSICLTDAGEVFLHDTRSATSTPVAGPPSSATTRSSCRFRSTM